MTWGNLLAKSSNLIILLPIVLKVFSPEDIVVWYLYFTIVSLQLLIDFGFLPTFTRLFSYAYSGLDIYELQDIKNNKQQSKSTNWLSCKYLFIATKKIYKKIAIIAFSLAITVGSYLAYTPIENTSDINNAWLGWFFVITIASFNLYANSYVAFLNGIDKVAIVQRWQMVSSVAAVISSSIIIFSTKSLLFGIMAFYIWYIVNFIINSNLLKKYYFEVTDSIDKDTLTTLIQKTIWPTAWKSGLGIGMSMGLIQFSGMIVAKLESSMISASYMMALQIIRAVSSFSQAPFYSRLPYFAKLYAQNSINTLLKEATKRMQKSLFVFLALFILIGFFMPSMLDFIGSQTKFPDMDIWILIGFGFLLERYGAMYLQLYTLTNHIIWHIANGITGLIMIIATLLVYPIIHIYAFPLAMIIGYMFFYVPYVVKKTYIEYNLNFINQEKFNFLLSLMIFIILSSLMSWR